MPHSPNFFNVTQSELEERLFFREYAFSGIQTLPQQQPQRNRICLQRLEPHVGIAESHSAKPACGALASERNNLESQVLNPYHFFPTLVVVKTTEYHFGQQRDLLCYQAHPFQQQYVQEDEDADLYEDSSTSGARWKNAVYDAQHSFSSVHSRHTTKKQKSHHKQGCTTHGKPYNWKFSVESF